MYIQNISIKKIFKNLEVQSGRKRRGLKRLKLKVRLELDQRLKSCFLISSKNKVKRSALSKLKYRLYHNFWRFLNNPFLECNRYCMVNFWRLLNRMRRRLSYYLNWKIKYRYPSFTRILYRNHICSSNLVFSNQRGRNFFNYFHLIGWFIYKERIQYRVRKIQFSQILCHSPRLLKLDRSKIRLDSSIKRLHLHLNYYNQKFNGFKYYKDKKYQV